MATGACTLVCVPECLQGRQLPSRSYCKRTESLRNACWGPRGPSGWGQMKGILRENSLYRLPGARRRTTGHSADVAGRAFPALRAAVAQLCRHVPGPMHHINAQEAWLALVQGARRPPPARSFRPSNDQGDLLESTLPAEVEAAMKHPRVIYRAAATGHDRAHDAGLGGSC